MKALITVFALIGALSAKAGTYPVDEAIAELNAKAAYLTHLKEIFETGNCQITVDGNTLKLVPGALRSEGLVMAIGPKFPGNYLAYHQAPKPEKLAIVASYTLKKDVRPDVMIIGSRLRYEGDKPTGLLISVNEPYEVPGAEDLWIYQQTWLGLPLNADGALISKEATSKSGKSIRLQCGQ